MDTKLLALTALLLAATTAALADDMDALLGKMRDFNAVQVVYRGGVPHTDRQGRLLTTYDPQRSFFQLGIWGNPWGTIYGYDYDLKVLTDAGFNTMWPWPMHTLEEELKAGAAGGLQVVTMRHVDPAEAARLKDDPAWLGNVWHDEPTGSFWGKDMQAHYDEFLAYKATLNQAAPGLPIFVNDVPWLTAPATSWWVKWNTAGDVECHDNYPLLDRKQRARTIGDDGNVTGIPTSVGFAAAVNHEQKPVWMIVGAFTTRGRGAFPFRMATPMQLRAQVYAALIHGATGIIYFCWDTYVCRDGDVIGMSPDPQVAYLEPGPGKPHASPARPMQLAESKALWMAATEINHEVQELVPSLLAPTVGEQVGYSVEVKGQAISDTPLRCLLKPHPDRGYVLLTVNLDDAVLDATYTWPTRLGKVTPLYENRDPLELTDDGTRFADLYEPFEVHVYRVEP